MDMKIWGRATAVIAAFTAGLLVLSGCAAADDAPENGGGDRGTLNVGVARSPNSFDPIQSFLGGQYMQYLDPVYDSLIRMNPDGSFDPGLATEWEYKSTTEFAMTLREGVTFSDGSTPFNADVVKANLDRLKDEVGPQTSDLSTMYESTEVVDDTHVVVHLTSPNPDLKRIFSQLLGMMVNPEAIGDQEALAANPAGTGPYVLDTAKTVVNDTYYYTKNENYWDVEEFPYSELVLKTFADQNAMLTALQSKTVSIGYGAPETVDAAKGFGLGIDTAPVNVAWLALNDREGEHAPALAEKKIRQALNYAIDRDAILKSVFRGQGKTTVQVFPEGTQGYDPSLNDAYTYDPTKAKQLLDEAGYGDGFSFEVGLAFPGRDSAFAEAIASYYKEIGVTMEIEPMPDGSYSAEDFKGYAGVIHAMGGQGAYADAQLLLQPTDTLWNPLASTDAEFDKLWKQGTDAESDEQRIADYEKLSAAVVEKAWFVPVVNTNAIYFFDKSVFDDAPFTPGLTVPQIHNWKFAG